MGTVNPKVLQAAADGKIPLDYLEPAANEVIALVLFGGANKYGRRNFKGTDMQLTTYIGAMMRHIAALQRGEMLDPDDGQHHLGHIGACVHVCLAALEAGTLIDDTSIIEVKERSNAVHGDGDMQAKAG
jgi:hypothetical protein